MISDYEQEAKDDDGYPHSKWNLVPHNLAHLTSCKPDAQLFTGGFHGLLLHSSSLFIAGVGIMQHRPQLDIQHARVCIVLREVFQDDALCRCQVRSRRLSCKQSHPRKSGKGTKDAITPRQRDEGHID